MEEETKLVKVENQETEKKGKGIMKLLALPFVALARTLNFPLPAPSYLMVGFLLIAGVSAWVNLEQARTIDSYGDVMSVEAELKEVRALASSERELVNHPDTKQTAKEAIRKNIQKLNKEQEALAKELTAQRQDVFENAAGVLNGSWLWTLLIQVGAAAFGVGIINLITCKNEDTRIRSSAIVVIGAVVIFLLLSRILVVSGLSDLMNFQ